MPGILAASACVTLLASLAGTGPAPGGTGSRALRLRQTNSKQSEAKANLKALFTAEKAYYQEKDHYSTNVGVVGFAPERGNRYRYVLTVTPASLEGRSGAYPVKSSTDEGIREDTFKFPAIPVTLTQGPCAGSPSWGITTPNVRTTGSNAPAFTGAAYGNIDGDDTLDVWTISTAGRVLSGPDCDAVGDVPSGEPANERNDATR